MSRTDRKYAIDARGWATEVLDVRYEYGNVLVTFRNGAIRSNMAIPAKTLAEIISTLASKARHMRVQADTLEKRLSGDAS